MSNDVRVAVYFTAPIQPNKYNQGVYEIAQTVASVVSRKFGGHINSSGLMHPVEYGKDHPRQDREAFVVMHVPEGIYHYEQEVGNQRLMDLLDFTWLRNYKIRDVMIAIGKPNEWGN